MIVVIAILAAIAIVTYNGIQRRSVETTIKSNLDTASQQLDIIYKRDGAYPTPSLPDDINGGEIVNFNYTSVDGSSYCLTGDSSSYSASVFHISSAEGAVGEGAC